MKRNLIKLLAGMAAAAGLCASAHAAGDADHGETIAKRWCAACHIVATDQKTGADNVPSFESIGARPDFSATKLAAFLRDPHPKMPNMALSRSDSDDLAAYIGKQGKQGK
jgi:mono/diheme cytochrome c family protein